ncbi:MAG: transporter substrate-binding domain-containing protein [Thermodesulfobacteriota bacterium]
MIFFLKSISARGFLGALLAATILIITGCSSGTDEHGVRDLERIESSGVLKAIVRPRAISFASPGLTQVLIDRKLAQSLAAELGLKLKLVVMDDNAAMFDMLRRGKADIIIAGLIASPGDGVVFSVPYRYTDEVLITKKAAGGAEEGESKPPGPQSSLKGRSICLSQGSLRTDAFKRLKRLGATEFLELPRGSGPDEALAKVESGECFAAAVDSVSWDELFSNYTSLALNRVLAKSLPISLAMSPGAINLRSRTNEYLIARSLSSGSLIKYKGDFDTIKKKKVLRMVTRNNSLTYYIYRGAPFGFEYEMVRKFADSEGLRLEVVLPPGHSELIPWLLDGRADIVAAAMTRTDNRGKEVAFTVPYNYVSEQVVVRGDDETIKSPSDLVGKTVHVRKSSSYYDSLMALKEKGFDFEIVLLPEAMETEDILEGISVHRWDITVSDSNLLTIEREQGNDVKAAFTLKKSGIGWAVRKEDVKLLARLNAFIKKQHKSFFYNTIKDKYFNGSVSVPEVDKDLRYDRSGRISPYDELVKKYAAMYGLDWRLVVSQMFQESSFNPRKVSWAGARGLMQLMPRTAKEFGLKKSFDPESSIKAGTYYMKKLLKRFGPPIKLKDRISFALASYHVGFNHVADARILAAKEGLNPDIWFDNVEKAMILLQKRSYYRKTKYGYCNGRRTVVYVRDILNRYNAYLHHEVHAAL